MVTTLTFNLNNGEKMELIQRNHCRKCLISIVDRKGFPKGPVSDEESFLSNDDMVGLLNYWIHVKRYDIQNDFINPNGKNTKMEDLSDN